MPTEIKFLGTGVLNAPWLGAACRRVCLPVSQGRGVPLVRPARFAPSQAQGCGVVAEWGFFGCNVVCDVCFCLSLSMHHLFNMKYET